MNPFPYTFDNKRYHTLAYHNRVQNCKTQKAVIDAGLSCPNIDGTCGVGGCIFCDGGSGYFTQDRALSVTEQLQAEKVRIHKKSPESKIIAYFQTHTNTYAPVERLRELYYAALSLPETVGLSIATRADCIDGEKAALLREISEKTYLTVELGLQTVHESTAALINRGHTYEEFLAGYEKLRGLNVCVHLINGLPGEDEEMMLESARSVAALRPHSVKIHMLYLERGCRMAEDYLASPFHILTGEEYISVTVSQLELFHPDTVIGRLTGDGMAQNLIAPLWSEKKFCVLNGIDKEFVRRGSFQGRGYFGALPQAPPLS